VSAPFKLAPACVDEESSCSTCSAVPVPVSDVSREATLGAHLTISGSAGIVAFLVLAVCDLVSAEEGGAVINSSSDDKFSIPAFIICVRESMEGCVIAAVLLNALHKSGQFHMKKWVWFGVLLGSVSFLVVGAVALIIFYAVGKAIPQQGKAAFEGILAIIACFILTKISLKFLRLKDLIIKWEGKLVQDKAAGEAGHAATERRQGAWGSFLLCIADFRDALNIRHQAIDKKDAEGELSWKVLTLITFSAMFREGVETVIFLLPISSTTSEVGLVTGAIAGIFVGIVFGIFVLAVGKYFLLDPSYFFYSTTVFIFFIAAGLSTYSVIELEQIGATPLKNMNHPILYRPVYNIGCLHETMGRIWTGVVDTKCFMPENTGITHMYPSNIMPHALATRTHLTASHRILQNRLLFISFFVLSFPDCLFLLLATGYDDMGRLRNSNVGLVFRALLGYRATPTILMCLTYCFYWMVICTMMMLRYKQVNISAIAVC